MKRDEERDQSKEQRRRRGGEGGEQKRYQYVWYVVGSIVHAGNRQGKANDWSVVLFIILRILSPWPERSSRTMSALACLCHPHQQACGAGGRRGGKQDPGSHAPRRWEVHWYPRVCIAAALCRPSLGALSGGSRRGEWPTAQRRQAGLGRKTMQVADQTPDRTTDSPREVGG